MYGYWKGNTVKGCTICGDMMRGMHRRQFLQHLGVAGTALALPGATFAAERVEASFSGAAFDVTTTEATLWARFKAGGRACFAVTAEGGSTTATAPRTVADGTDFVLIERVNNLRPDTRYNVRICDDRVDPVEPTSRASFGFATAPAARRAITFAFSGDVHAQYQPFSIFDRVLERKPEFFIHLGDTVYADQPKRLFKPTLDHYRFKHREIRSDAALQHFLAAVPCVAMWDDHEVENDFIGSHPAIPQGRQAFTEYWPNLNSHGRSANKLYRKLPWSPLADFFLVDTRQYRVPDETILGREQYAWLKRELAASKAPFKFVCTSVPFHSNSPDKWGGFREERDGLKQFIRDENIRTVVFLSADVHAMYDYSNERAHLYEFMVGPLAAPTLFEMQPSARARWAERNKFYLGDERNFGVIRIEPTRGGATLTLQVVDSQGKTRYERRVESS